jgi:hypothetical protein
LLLVVVVVVEGLGIWEEHGAMVLMVGVAGWVGVAGEKVGMGLCLLLVVLGLGVVGIIVMGTRTIVPGATAATGGRCCTRIVHL